MTSVIAAGQPFCNGRKKEQHFAQERLVQLKVFADKKVARIGCYSAPGKSASCSQSSFTLKKGN